MTIDLKKDVITNTILGGDFNTILSLTDRLNSLKFNNKIMVLKEDLEEKISTQSFLSPKS